MLQDRNGPASGTGATGDQPGPAVDALAVARARFELAERLHREAVVKLMAVESDRSASAERLIAAEQRTGALRATIADFRDRLATTIEHHNRELAKDAAILDARIAAARDEAAAGALREKAQAAADFEQMVVDLRTAVAEADFRRAAAVAEEAARGAAVRTRLAEFEARVGEMRLAMRDHAALLERATAAEERVRSLRRTKTRLTERVEEQRKRAEHFKKRFRAVTSSRSWRLMAPLRVMGRLGRRLLGRG